SMPNIGDFFITHSIERLLHSHECLKVPMHERPSPETISRLRECDALVICGSNLIGVEGTVRIAYEVSDFERIGKPIYPIGLGIQSDIDGKVNVDRRGRALLKYWAKKSGGISVRDEATERYLGEIVGPENIVLTGCPSLTLRSERFARSEEKHLF